jgi:hypothetical protein
MTLSKHLSIAAGTCQEPASLGNTKDSIGGLTYSHTSNVLNNEATQCEHNTSHLDLVEMARKSAGFVSKKPHRKSRGGCLTCKRKKVKVLPKASLLYEHVITSL